MSLLSRFRSPRPREVSVYVSLDPNGHKSVSIHGGTPSEIATLMETAMQFAAPSVATEPPLHVYAVDELAPYGPR